MLGSMRHVFHASQWVPYAPAPVFAFFADPANLPRLMPRWQQARIDHAFYAAPPSEPGASSGKRFAGQGTVLTITFRALPFVPLRLQWVAVIDEFAWNDHFCDTQKTGPLAYWHHCHTIQAETQNGIPGSRIEDDVTFALPFGLLGDLAYLLGVKKQMQSTFAYRQQRLLELLPAEIAAT